MLRKLLYLTPLMYMFFLVFICSFAKNKLKSCEQILIKFSVVDNCKRKG